VFVCTTEVVAEKKSVHKTQRSRHEWINAKTDLVTRISKKRKYKADALNHYYEVMKRKFI
jgi:predicted solute-binding protein